MSSATLPLGHYVVLKIAARSERVKRTKVAIVHYGTYIHCAGVHVYREDAKKSKELLLNKVNMARRIMMYRATLEAGIHRKERRYVAPLISQPQQLNPWEWQEWLTMLRSGANIDALLERFGLVRMTSLDAKELAIANAMASKVTVNPEINIQGPTINNTQTASPNISFSPSTTMSPNHILHGGHGMHAEAPTPSSQMHIMGSAAGYAAAMPPAHSFNNQYPAYPPPAPAAQFAPPPGYPVPGYPLPQFDSAPASPPQAPQKPN